MAFNLPQPQESRPVDPLDRVERRPLKAELSDQPRSNALSLVVKDALIRHFGSLKAAAYALGQIDLGQLSRELDTGKFKLERLEHVDADAKAAVARALSDTYGPLATPEARIRMKLREIRAALAEIEQYLESVA